MRFVFQKLLTARNGDLTIQIIEQNLKKYCLEGLIILKLGKRWSN